MISSLRNTFRPVPEDELYARILRKEPINEFDLYRPDSGKFLDVLLQRGKDERSLYDLLHRNYTIQCQGYEIWL